MKRIILAAAILFGASTAFAQQEFQQSQYMQNMYILNPAASGLTDYIDVNLGYRNQWTGLTGAPETYYLSGSSMLGKSSAGSNELFSLRISDPSISTESGLNLNANNTVKKQGVRHAVGGVVYVDNAGHFRKTHGGVSYAVHVPLSANVNFSAGLRLGFSQLSVDPDITFAQSNDVTADKVTDGSSNGLDGNLGLFLYSNKFFLGWSGAQLFQNDLDFNGGTTEDALKLHHFILAGYRFDLTDKVGLTPSVMAKAVSGTPLSIDFNAKLDINKKYWLGGSYRADDAVVVMAGLNINKFINLGYSYDITMSDVNSVSSGSHEIVLNLMLAK